MEHTHGLGLEAEVWVGGDLLTVCDAISAPDSPCPPGMLTDVTFAYASLAGFSWDQAVRANPGKRMRLEPLRRWAYTGYGRVVSIAPAVIVDFGLLQMEDANWTTDRSLVGQFVRIPIDRLEIVPAHRPDWPEDAS